MNRCAKTPQEEPLVTGARPPFLFIVGCGRSGTSLLRTMCNAHRDLAVMFEPHFVGVMARRMRRYEQPDGFRTDRFLDDLSADRKFRAIGVRQEALRLTLQASPPADFADAVRCVFRTFAAQEGKARYGDKTPNYVFAMPLLAETFPESRFVHLVRDGRDVALAYADAGWGPTSAVEGALYWRKRVRAALESGGRLRQGRYLELRYEDLVAAPEPALRQVCAFADLPFDPSMLLYYERPGSIGAANPKYHEGLLVPPTIGRRDWRTQMPAGSQRRFEALAGDLLDTLGYERGAEPLTASDRIGARCLHARSVVAARVDQVRSWRTARAS